MKVDDPTIVAKLADLTTAIEAKFIEVHQPAVLPAAASGFGLFSATPEAIPVLPYEVTETLIWRLNGKAQCGATEQATAANISEECARLIDKAAKADIEGGKMLLWRQRPECCFDYDFFTREIQIGLFARGHIVK